MTYKSLPRHGKSGINEASREGATNTRPALEHRHLDRRRQMSRYGQYSDSTNPCNPEQTPDKWKTIGELAAALAAKVGAK